MNIQFAYTISPKVKWSTNNFIELNERINKIISSCNIDLNEKIKTLYVGILYLNDEHFDKLNARKLRTSLSKQSVSIEVKIPQDLTTWDDIERLIISEIINAIKIIVNKKYIKSNEIINLLLKTFQLTG